VFQAMLVAKVAQSKVKVVQQRLAAARQTAKIAAQRVVAEKKAIAKQKALDVVEHRLKVTLPILPLRNASAAVTVDQGHQFGSR